MDAELLTYERLADPSPPKPFKSKAPAISATLADLVLQLKQARDALANGASGGLHQDVKAIIESVSSQIEKSKGLVDDRLKETHASATKIGKLIDKVSLGMPNCKDRIS